MPRDYNLIKKIVRNVDIIISYTILGLIGGIVIDLIIIPLSAIIASYITDNQSIINTIAESVGISCSLIGGIIGCITGILYIIKINNNENQYQLLPITYNKNQIITRFWF